MRLYLEKASYWAEKLLTDINLPALLPDEDNNFGGSLGLDFRKWCHRIETKNWFLSMPVFQEENPRTGTRDFKWQGWSNGAKNQDPNKSLGLHAKPKIIPGPKELRSQGTTDSF